MAKKELISAVIISLFIVSLIFLVSGCSKNINNETIVKKGSDVIASTTKEQPAQNDVQNSSGEQQEEPEQAQEEETEEGESLEPTSIRGKTLGDLMDIMGNAGFIVGNKAPAIDIVTVSEIKSSLAENNIDSGSAELADEIGNYTSKNYFIIGSPCDNPVAADLLAEEIAKKGSCRILSSGEGMIKLVSLSSTNFGIIVSGGTGEDTRKAGRALFEQLSGTKVIVGGSIDNPTVE